jgi:hypothetical protein
MPKIEPKIPLDLAYLFNAEQINIDALKKVDLVDLPSWIDSVVAEFHKENYCHYNAMTLVQTMKNNISEEHSGLLSDIKYVIGYIVGLDIVEHAFVKIGDSYYDPTLPLSKSKDLDIYVLEEIDAFEMQILLEKYNMKDHGLLLMNFRRDIEFQHLFCEPGDMMLRIMEASIDEYHASNDNLIPNLGE